MNTQRQDKIHTVNYLLVICVESQLSESDIHSFKIAIVQEESFFVPKIYYVATWKTRSTTRGPVLVQSPSHLYSQVWNPNQDLYLKAIALRGMDESYYFFLQLAMFKKTFSVEL